MGFNQLPAGYDRAKLGPQKRRTKFDSPEEKLAYDAQRLIERAELQSRRLGRPVDPITFAERKDNDIEALQAAIDAERAAVQVAIEAAMPGAAIPGAAELRTDLSPEQIWLDELQLHFNALPQLHTGIEWTDVEKSLRADPEAMRRLRELDKNGHQMNVFGEEKGEFIFVSAWDNYEQVAPDHRNIAYDLGGQALAEAQSRQPNDNAVSIIARIMDVKEDEAGNYLAAPRFHKQLRKAIAVSRWAQLKPEADAVPTSLELHNLDDGFVRYWRAPGNYVLPDAILHEQLRNSLMINGWAWLKTNADTRRTGEAVCGSGIGLFKNLVDLHSDRGSFRAELRVKRV